MTLNYQSNIFAGIAAIIVVALLTIAHFSIIKVHDQNERITNAENTVKVLTNFRFLILETVVYQENQIFEQWQRHIADLTALLASQNSTQSNENDLLNKQHANLNALKQLYARLLKNNLQSHQTLSFDSTSKEFKDDVSHELFTVIQTMLGDAFELVRLNRLDLAGFQAETVLIMQFSIIGLAMLIALSCILFKRRILMPIAKLKLGTERVAKGELNYRLNLNIDNEIGSLADAFDHMTAEFELACNTTQSTVQMLANQSNELVYIQQQLQTIINHIPALIGSWDIHFHNLFGNCAYTEWFGVTPTEMRGKHMQDIIGPAHFEQLKPNLLTVLQGHSAVFEKTLLTSAGEERHVVFSYVPNMENGVVKGFYGFVSDVTQLRQAQVAKEKVLAQLQGIVDAARDFAILEGDEKGTITLFSKGAEILLGYKAEEIVGKTDAGIFHLREEIIARSNELTLQYGRRIRGFDTFVELARQGESESREWTYVRKDGSTLPVNLTVTAICNQNGNITGYLGIAKDISKDKEILKTLAETRDKAEAASLSKSQFLANMSHEIRTPMNAILGMLQLLHHTEMTTRQLDYVNKTQSAARSLLDLLNDILDFSKVEANKMTLELLLFNLDTLMRDLSAIFSCSVGNKDVEVLFATDTALPPCIVGDEMRLRQVLINLVGNAIKFTHHGEVVVSLKILKQDSKYMEILFSVQDSGIGIAPEKLAYIFEGFTQAESSTTRRFGGTGLGLAISQRLVALMGGELAVESTLNVGSRFYFTLKFEYANQDNEKVAIRELAARALKNTISPHVLIVDDNENAREVLLGLVQSLGWKGKTASSGEVALTLLKQSEIEQSPYDVIFMDWKMPIMDGLETTRQIRQLQQGAKSVIIMLTAHDRDTLVEQLQTDRNLLNGFLVKPVTASMLLDAVTESSHESLRIAKNPKVMRLAGLRLLVVEDTLLNQEVAQELLSSEGAYVEVADNGALGVEKVLADGSSFDAVLMDIQMPIMDGYVATSKIRENPCMQSLPIIAMTANAMTADKEACRVAGMNDHIAKPIDLDDVVATLLRHCSLKNATVLSVATELETKLETQLENKVSAEVQNQILPTLATKLNMPSPIEFDKAVQRLGDNKLLFVKLAQRFFNDINPMVINFLQYVEQNEWSKASAVMHTIKGMAATLGAVRLAKYTADVEQKLKTDKTGISLAGTDAELKLLIKQTQTALEQIIVSLQPVSLSTTMKISGIDKAILNDLLNQLDPLLQGKNMRATYIFSELEKKIGNQLQDHVSLLAQAINCLDFKRALEYSHQLRARLS